MLNYRTTSHAKYDLKAHLVWVPKYRKRILHSQIGYRIRELIREICQAHDIQIISGKIAPDHVHIFISYPPYLSLSKIVQLLKGKTSRKILAENREIRAIYWGSHFWARGYFAVSSGNITDEMIMQYIDEQEGENIHADDLQVVN